MTDTDAAATAPLPARPGALIGYARCSTVAQDTEIQRAALAGYGVPVGCIYVDEGFTGTTTPRPGLDRALAAVHAGDTLIVPRLDRFARSVPDARSLADLIISRRAACRSAPPPGPIAHRDLGLAGLGVPPVLRHVLEARAAGGHHLCLTGPTGPASQPSPPGWPPCCPT